MDLLAVFRYFNIHHKSQKFDPVPCLNRLSCLFEVAHKELMKTDPDPFDEQESLYNMNCEFGNILNYVVTQSVFMKKLMSAYLKDSYWVDLGFQDIDPTSLNTAAARILCYIIKNKKICASLFQDELVEQLFAWANGDKEPLKSYSTSLLDSAMTESLDNDSYSDLNARLMNGMFPWLRESQMRWIENRLTPAEKLQDLEKGKSFGCKWTNLESLLIGHFQIYPLSDSARQIIILRYISSVIFQSQILDQMTSVMDIDDLIDFILKYCEKPLDSRLAFEALCFLGEVMMLHEKVAIQFIDNKGLRRILSTPLPSITATGVAKCLIAIARYQRVMLKVSQLPQSSIFNLVNFALRLLQVHPTGRRYATLFLKAALKFQSITKEFTRQEGLRHVFNRISTLQFDDLLADECHKPEEWDFDHQTFNDLSVRARASRDTLLDILYTIKQYRHYDFEHHLSMEVEAFQQEHSSTPGTCKLEFDQVQELITTFLSFGPSCRAQLLPVRKFVKLGGIHFLLRVLATMKSKKWTFKERSEIILVTLDVLAVCSVDSEVRKLLCERIVIPPLTNDYLKESVVHSTVGVKDLLELSSGENLEYLHIQRAALAILSHCVCPLVSHQPPLDPSHLAVENQERGTFLASFRSHGGIMIMKIAQTTKSNPYPVSQPIRHLASKVLTGVARNEEALQILKELPSFTYGKPTNDEANGLVPSKRTNFAARIMNRSFYPSSGGRGPRKDSQLGYSNFRPIWLYKSNDVTYSSCASLPCRKFLFTGDNRGRLHLFNLQKKVDDQDSGDGAADDRTPLEVSYECHGSSLLNIEINRSGHVVLTSGFEDGKRQMSRSWLFNNYSCLKLHDFQNQHHLEFGKRFHDTVVGTEHEKVTVFDLESGCEFLQLSPLTHNYYRKNKATFSYDDRLILSSGILWDVNSGKEIHLFDQLNLNHSGKFHPNGVEIIAGDAIWDIRTHRLLQTHQTFNNCVPVFSSGNVIHVMPDNLASSFTTVDAQDYSTISTFDLKREIHSFSSNYDSTQLVLTANLKTADSSIVYIYDLYRLKLMANKGPGEERNQFLNGICADSDVSSSQQSTLSSDSTESY